jgi:hypothetical protein
MGQPEEVEYLEEEQEDFKRSLGIQANSLLKLVIPAFFNGRNLVSFIL